MESLTQLNLVAPARLLQAVIPGMRTRKRGRILVIGSGAGTFPMPGQAVYVATKHGLHGLCDAVRLELKGSGVTLTESMPGLVEMGFDAAAGIEGGMGGPVAGLKISARECAEDSLEALDRGRAVCFPGRRYNAFMTATNLPPARLLRLVASRQ